MPELDESDDILSKMTSLLRRIHRLIADQGHSRFKSDASGKAGRQVNIKRYVNIKIKLT